MDYKLSVGGQIYTFTSLEEYRQVKAMDISERKKYLKENFSEDSMQTLDADFEDETESAKEGYSFSSMINAIANIFTKPKPEGAQNSGTTELSASSADKGALEPSSIGGTQEIQNDSDDENNKKTENDEKKKGAASAKTKNASVKTNKNGKVSEVEVNGKQHKINYDSKGNMKSVVIDGKEYTDVSAESKNYGSMTTVKDENGNVVMSYQKRKNGKSCFKTYSKDGKADKALRLNKDNKIAETVTYKDNKAAYKEFTGSTRTRYYNYDSSGKLVSSDDYSSKDKKKKLSSQTYVEGNASQYYSQDTGKLWATRTFYDDNGKVEKKSEYDYKKQSDGNVERIKTSYDSKHNLLSKVTALTDSTRTVIGRIKESGGVSVSGDSSVGQGIVDYAESFLGYNANSNKAGKNKFVSVTRGGGCDDFATYVVDRAVNEDELASWYKNLTKSEKAWSPDIVRAAKENGGLVNKNQIQTGDLVYLKIGGKTVHTVICKEVKNGKLYTIESNGNGKVSNKTYNLSDIRYVIRPTKGN